MGKPTPADFRKIPVLDKEAIRKNQDKLISTDPSRKGVPTNTGGSTGETLYFYKDAGVVDYRRAHIVRINKMCDADVGDKEAVFWGSPFDVKRINRLTHVFKQYLQNVVFFSTFDMSEKSMFKYADIIRRFKPKIIRGYPSALFTFTEFLKKNNITHTLVEVGCIGLCYAEPIVCIYTPDGPTICYGNIDPDKAIELIKNHISKKKPMAKYALGVLSDKKTDSIPKLVETPVFKHQVRRVLNNCGIINPSNIKFKFFLL